MIILSQPFVVCGVDQSYTCRISVFHVEILILRGKGRDSAGFFFVKLDFGKLMTKEVGPTTKLLDFADVPDPKVHFGALRAAMLSFGLKISNFLNKPKTKLVDAPLVDPGLQLVFK